MKIKEKVIGVTKKILLMAGIVIAFYRLPNLIAEKISYWKLKYKKID